MRQAIRRAFDVEVDLVTKNARCKMTDDILKKLEDAISRPDTAPRIYILYVGEMAVLVFSAQSLTEARQIIREQWLIDELRAATIAGQPLGPPNARIRVVRATSQMEQAYKSGTAGKPKTDELDLVYVVPIDGLNRSV